MVITRFFLLLSFIMLTISNVNALVREVGVSSNEMATLSLRMGQSTVLRFNEQPVKGVVGNQNYYNVEFIQNTNDVTIQPLGEVSTNLFIYCKHHTYGFLLKTTKNGKYDDLVKVRWNSRPSSYAYNNKSKKRVTTFSIKFSIKNVINFSVEDITYNSLAKLWIIDLNVNNIGQDDVELKNVTFSITRRNKALQFQPPIFLIEKLKKNDSGRIRIFLNLKIKQGFTLHASYKEANAKVIIPRARLR